MTPNRAGLSLAITIGVFYAACTLVWWVAPDRFLILLNGLFHGLDFSLLRTQRGFDGTTFIAVTAAWMIWAYALGAFHAWVWEKFANATHGTKGENAT